MGSLIEKLEISGAVALSDSELISVVFGDATDDGVSIADRLLEVCSGSLSKLSSSSLALLRSADGVGEKRASRVLAAIELGRRCALAVADGQVAVFNSQDVVALFRPRVMMLQHEECWVLYLNAANNIIEQQRVSHGGLDATIVDHRLIVKRALELLALKIVVVHNHPTGISHPSAEDIAVTKRIQAAAMLFDIVLLDHVIVSCDGDFSFRGASLL
ncbi:MAG: DNA repair protein RadC [Rikenellaceae bacterium]